MSDPDSVEEILTQAEYFEKNAERMRYPKFGGQHRFVGCGVIEAGRLTPTSMSRPLGCIMESDR